MQGRDRDHRLSQLSDEASVTIFDESDVQVIRQRADVSHLNNAALKRCEQLVVSRDDAAVGTASGAWHWWHRCMPDYGSLSSPA